MFNSKISMRIISAALLLTSVCCKIQFQQHKDDKSLSRTTTELLSSFNQCIVFIFDWIPGLDYEKYPSTPTKYFVFYSESLSCSLVVETLRGYRGRITNPRFADEIEPHPLFTKHATVLVNLYATAAMYTDLLRQPDPAVISLFIKMYNVPFNYVLFFMSSERFPLNNLDMFRSFTEASAPAVYIVVLDKQAAYVVGFGHVFQKAPYLFKVEILKESLIQELARKIHKNLGGSLVKTYGTDFSTPCKHGSPIYASPHGCAVASLLENYNLTVCHAFQSFCSYRRYISIFYVNQRFQSDGMFTRGDIESFEFINNIVTSRDFSFICIVQTGQMGFVLFANAFDPQTWVVATVGFISLTVTVSAMSINKHISWSSKLQQSASVVIMLLFERFYASAQLQRAASRQTILVLTLWAFGAMLLGMIYGGNVVTELTVPSLPALPQNMHELSQVEYPIFTTTSHTFVARVRNSDDFRIKEGTIHDQIEDYLEKTNAGKVGTLTDDLRRLSTAMTFVNMTSLPVGEPDSSQSPKVLFAIAGSTFTEKALGLRGALMNSRLRALPGEQLPFFTSHGLIAIRSNPLLPIFRKYLAKICEPGLCKYWQLTAEAWATTNIIFTHFEETNIVLGAEWYNRVNLMEIWHDFRPLMYGNAASLKPIVVENLIPAFQLLALGLFISLLVLLNERWPLHFAVRLAFYQTVKVLTPTCAVVQSIVNALSIRDDQRIQKILRK